MSANLVVDLGATCDYRASINVGSGSNLVIGEIIDLLGANTFCNLFVAGNGVAGGSGAIEVRVQTSDATTSGSFTDPTSGLAQMPTTFASGGAFFANSGLWASGWSSPYAPVNNAPQFCSGGIQFAAFQRNARFARLVLNSGPFPGPITAGFVTNKRVIGSGAGSTQNPGSGAVTV